MIHYLHNNNNNNNKGGGGIGGLLSFSYYMMIFLVLSSTHPSTFTTNATTVAILEIGKGGVIHPTDSTFSSSPTTTTTSAAGYLSFLRSVHDTDRKTGQTRTVRETQHPGMGIVPDLFHRAQGGIVIGITDLDDLNSRIMPFLSSKLQNKVVVEEEVSNQPTTYRMKIPGKVGPKMMAQLQAEKITSIPELETTLQSKILSTATKTTTTTTTTTTKNQYEPIFYNMKKNTSMEELQDLDQTIANMIDQLTTETTKKNDDSTTTTATATTILVHLIVDYKNEEEEGEGGVGVVRNPNNTMLSSSNIHTTTTTTTETQRRHLLEQGQQDGGVEKVVNEAGITTHTILPTHAAAGGERGGRGRTLEQDYYNGGSGGKYSNYQIPGYYDDNGNFITNYRTIYQIQYYNIVLWTAIGLFLLLGSANFMTMTMPLMPDTLLFGESAKMVAE